MRLVIIHYHLRPGGIRRIIELATPHLVRNRASPHAGLANLATPRTQQGKCDRQRRIPRAVRVARLRRKWGEHPISEELLHSLFFPRMKHNKFSQDKNQKAAGASRPTSATSPSQGGIDFAPSADEVARRAYASYVSQGSQPGHDVEHWLAAEGQLLAERKLT